MSKTNKTKKTGNTERNQPSVAAFLTKSRKPVVTNRTEFLSAKISETIQNSNTAGIVKNIGDSNAEKIAENTDEMTNATLQCEQKCKQCKTNIEKLKEAKVLLKKTSHVNLQKDLLIDKLKGDSQINQTKNNLYQEFESSFNEVDLRAIRSIGPGPSKDSTFVNRIMASLYKGTEFDKLRNRRAKGGKYNGIQKNGVTPEKKEIIKRMLQERVNAELTEGDVKNRMGHLNRLIRSAIHNILAAAEKVLKKKGNGKSPHSVETLKDRPEHESQESAVSIETVDSLQNCHSSYAQGNHSFVPQNTYQLDSQTTHQLLNYTTNQPSYPHIHPYHPYPFVPQYSPQPDTSHQFAPHSYPYPYPYPYPPYGHYQQ